MPGKVTQRISGAKAASFSAVCFRSQQNHAPWPTKTGHGRKQGNGGTLEAAETINSYGLFDSRQDEEPGGFFPSCRGANDGSHRRAAAVACCPPYHSPRTTVTARRMGRAKRNPSILPDVKVDGFRKCSTHPTDCTTSLSPSYDVFVGWVERSETHQYYPM